ncbi:glycosyltransferase family 2 protein [Methanococcus maripaludis]|uniref:Glycosyltransferase involved in cell wall biosynthesis n=2 Tax=Methanococcus maripaludis TaxID=39152 RepID=A0A7J9PG78_METMI|nr:glycosyltransferase family 2 protein [Methanococcus maripaludis]MBA2862111.1 glycosyltransferase involved in cell wall biosynthesis [Methanococcus maripaludis]
MKKLKLCVLITTMNENIKRVKEELLPQLKNCEVVISHQITNGSIKPYNEILGNNVKYVYMYDKGLSKNRNNALKHATGDICIICDDDVNFVDNFEEKIKSSYSSESIDIVTYKSVDFDGKERKNYPKTKFKHNLKSILSVSSIEISFKRDPVISKGLTFDENFGFSKYIGCEENIFLKDCLDNGLNVIFVPEQIVIHPIESSGTFWTEHSVYSKGAAFKRMYGTLGGLSLCFILSLLKYKSYGKNLSFFKFLRLILNGFFEYTKT